MYAWWSIVIMFVQLMIHIHSLAHLLHSMLYRWQGARKSSLNSPWPSNSIPSAWSRLGRPIARFCTSRRGLPMYYTDIVSSLSSIFNIQQTLPWILAFWSLSIHIQPMLFVFVSSSLFTFLIDFNVYSWPSPIFAQVETVDSKFRVNHRAWLIQVPSFW